MPKSQFADPDFLRKSGEVKIAPIPVNQYNKTIKEELKEKKKMTEYSKFNFVYRLQRWMDSVPGQTFLNYAYSWGASIVILGTLFKLTHLPGANFFLFLGMGTEVFVFFISAFDRPFDKTTDGMNLDIHMAEEGEQAVAAAGGVAGGGGGTVIINGGSGGSAFRGQYRREDGDFQGTDGGGCPGRMAGL